MSGSHASCENKTNGDYCTDWLRTKEATSASPTSGHDLLADISGAHWLGNNGITDYGCPAPTPLRGKMSVPCIFEMSFCVSVICSR